MDAAVVVGGAGAIIALLTFVVVSHRYQSDKLDAAKDLLRAELAAVAERESKSRHDKNAEIHLMIDKLDQEVIRLREQAVRREEWLRIEARLDRLIDTVQQLGVQVGAMKGVVAE